jgi:NADH-quinone oxidoreductase subunit I
MEEPPHPMRLGDDERDYYLRSGVRGDHASSARHAEDADRRVAQRSHDQRAEGTAT